MTKIDHGDGESVRLPEPFSHLTVTYPYEWAQPNRVHVFDEHRGTGTLYAPEYARALAETILKAMAPSVQDSPPTEG